MKLPCVVVLSVLTFAHGKPWWCPDHGCAHDDPSGFYPGNLPYQVPCQQYGIELVNGHFYRYVCKSYTTRIGDCPKNTTQISAKHYYQPITCLTDSYCPIGLKCCPDEGVKYFHVCKEPIFGNQVCEPPAS